MSAGAPPAAPDRPPGLGPERPRHHPQPGARRRAGDRLRPRPARARACCRATPRPCLMADPLTEPGRASWTTCIALGRGARAPAGCCSPPTTRRIAAIGPREAEVDAVLRRPWSPWAGDAPGSSTRATSTPSPAAIGFPVPATVRAEPTAPTSPRPSRELRFPVILKPRYAPEFRRRFRRPGARGGRPRRSCGRRGSWRPRTGPQISRGDPGRGRRDLGRWAATATPTGGRWPRSPAASCASGRRASAPAARPRRAGTRSFAARGHELLDALGLPRHLAAGGQARPARRPRLPDRGQPALVAVDRPRHGRAASTCPTRRGATPSGAPRRRAPAATASGRALDARDQAPRGQRRARSAAGTGARGAFLAHAAPADGRRGASTRATPGRCSSPLPPLARRAVAELRILRIEGARRALRPAGALGARDPRRGARATTPALDRRPRRPRLRARRAPAEGVWIPADARRAGVLRGGRRLPGHGRRTAPGASPCCSRRRHPERRDPGRPGGERLLPAGPLGRAARGRPRPLRPPAAGRERVRPHRRARPRGARRSRATSRALRRALGLPPPSGWSVALTHDIDRIRRRTPEGPRRHRPPAAGRAGVARARCGPGPLGQHPRPARRPPGCAACARRSS